MAKRRMFSLDIINTDNFLEMPATTQLLYFHLSLRADDDGFVSSPKRIIRLLGSSEDDLKILFSKQYIIPFDSGICVIKHWKIHNYIQKDRYTATIYKEEKSQLREDENGTYNILDTKCIHNVSKMDTQVRLGKDSSGKEKIDKNRTNDKNMTREGLLSKVSNFGETPSQSLILNSFSKQKDTLTKNPIKIIVENYQKLCPSLPKVIKITKSRENAILKLFKEYSIEEISDAMKKVEESNFLTGRTNQQWKANFDWIIKLGNLNKILEGSYDNKQNTNPSTQWEPEYTIVDARNRS